ncbi:MAG: PIN domain-containing protein [Chloroflexota bacterium]|nr:PIN domain-containing protein [Chloroflexota bacterium]
MDTWGWITLHNVKEPRHPEVQAYFRRFVSTRGVVITSDYVLDETYTGIFRWSHFSKAEELMLLISEAVAKGFLVVEWVTPERFARTEQLRLQLQDKPRISFTDLSSMVIMEELHITEVVTEDAHFTHVGKAFQLVP